MVKSLYCHLGSTEHGEKLNIDEDFNFKEGSIWSYMSLIVRKPVLGVSDQVRHKLGCTATEDG